MVLRLTVRSSYFLREAVEAIPVDGLAAGMVMISWSPRYFVVKSVSMVRNTPISLLVLAPQSFTSFESTDRHFNAIVESEQLHQVFRAAQDSDPVEFSQSFECDRIRKHGVLNARFNRPVNTWDSMNDTISMTIIDIRCEDMSHHPSSPNIPLVPMVRFYTDEFMDALWTRGTTEFTCEKESEGREIEATITSNGEERGVISMREEEDGNNIIEPIIIRGRVRFNLQELELEGGAGLSNEVAVFRSGEELGLIWFRLGEKSTRLHGHIIHCLP